MKSKSFVLATLLVAIVAAYLWWMMRPTAASPEKSFKTPLPAKTDMTKLDIPTAQVGPPKLPPAPPGAKTTEPAPTVVDPRANLDTAISEASRLYQNDDIVAYWVEFTPPDTPERLAKRGRTIEQQAELLKQDLDNDPNKAGRITSVVDIYRSIEGQTPTISDDGKTAVYNTVVNGQKYSVIWEKQGGLWYFDDYHGGIVYNGPAN